MRNLLSKERFRAWIDRIICTWIPEKPKIGDVVDVSGQRGRITKITKDYVEVFGVFPLSDEVWRWKFDRRKIKHFRKIHNPAYDRWDFSEVPRYTVNQ